MTNFRVGLNPLPWVLTASGFELSVPVLHNAFGEIRRTPFRGIHADPPAELDADGYARLLEEFGLVPAPGYFSANFADQDTEAVVEAASGTPLFRPSSAIARFSSPTRLLRHAAKHRQ